MIFGPRGEGKTFWSWPPLVAIATGAEFLGWKAPKRRKVFLIDGELPATVLPEQIRSLWPEGCRRDEIWTIGSG